MCGDGPPDESVVYGYGISSHSHSKAPRAKFDSARFCIYPPIVLVMAYVPPHKRMQQPTREHDDTDAKIFSEAFSVTRCINLDQRKDKWKQMQRQAARIRGLKIERFSALESKQGGGDDARVAMEWDTSSNARWDRKIPTGEIRHLSTGEVGCALSHLSLIHI